MYVVSCRSCGRDIDRGRQALRCPTCAGPLGFAYSAPFRPVGPTRSMWDFAEWLPVLDPAGAVTLGEGGTPLIQARLDAGCRLWWKDETRNPTGSHKDRALSLAVSKAVEFGCSAVVLASAGSTGLSSAAYAGRAGLRCAVLVPSGTPPERVIPLQLLGARVFAFAGDIDRAFALLETVGVRYGAYETSTYRLANPYQGEAAKTIAYEVWQDLGGAPDWLIVPTGGGGTLSGLWRGFEEIRAAGLIERSPRLAAVQPRAYNAFEIAERDGLVGEDELRAIPIDPSVQTALVKLAHTYPPDGVEALAAVRSSGGCAISVDDGSALESLGAIGAREGLFVEPSAAAGLAGLRLLVARGLVHATDRVVVVLSGAGFRELGVLAQAVQVKTAHLSPEGGVEALGEFLGGAPADA